MHCSRYLKKVWLSYGLSVTTYENVRSCPDNTVLLSANMQPNAQLQNAESATKIWKQHTAVRGLMEKAQFLD